MIAVLNKRWLSKGWRVMDIADSEPMALAWIEILNRHEIPHGQYFELYRRSLDLRVRLLNEGMEADDFSADMMAACWPGLRAELRQREIDARRTLTTTASSQCLRCYGTGMERVFDDEGNYIGTRPGCKHEYIDTEEPSAAGMQMVEDTLRRATSEETALDICRRVRRSLAQDWIKAAGTDDEAATWVAQKSWMHAEIYIREYDGK